MEKQFVLDYNDAHEETDIDSNIGFQADYEKGRTIR